MAKNNSNYAESVNRSNKNIVNGRFKQKSEEGGVIIPSLLALAFSLAGLALGVLLLMVGFYASISGIVAALLAKIGWELGKGKIGVAKVIVIVVFTIVISILTEFIGVYLALLVEGFTLSIPDYLSIVFSEPEVINAFVTDIVILLVFAAIGAVMVVIQVIQEIKLKRSLIEKGLPLFEDAPKTEESAVIQNTVVTNNNIDTKVESEKEDNQNNDLNNVF